MGFLKLLLAAAFVSMSLLTGLFFALGGLWSALGFTLFATSAAVVWRMKLGGGRDWIYFVGFFVAQMLEIVLIALCIQNEGLGMHRIMDGYAAPTSTQALLALAPVIPYVAAVLRWGAGASSSQPAGR